jgi:short-subunit dehydrogenase
MAPSLSSLYPTAFVTGASAGLGRAFAVMLLEEEVRVWGTSRDGARLTELANRFPALFTPVVLDLNETEAGLLAFRRAAKAAGGAFDLLVNNAGYGVYGPFEAAEPAVWRRQIEAMLTMPLELCQEALQQMRARDRGCIVNVASLAVEYPLPFMSGYNVAKAGLSALSESLVIETRGSGISVIDFRPGDFQTDFNRAMQFVSPLSAATSSPVARAWESLEANLRSAPPVSRAAADLRRALAYRRRGTVRSGGWFQTRLASWFACCVPASWRRFAAARYFGI